MTVFAKLRLKSPFSPLAKQTTSCYVFYKPLLLGGRNASLLRKVPFIEGNQGRQADYYEERTSRYSGRMPILWHQDVPYW
ncbi:uncharacterized protein METZ01_LOCUS183927 [marine metagenome]|uniref:Uncharacterized protein n=1 Tax=marine metagenome TaxID=408172 RepID=A0A382D0H3_9ZZZZ